MLNMDRPLTYPWRVKLRILHKRRVTLCLLLTMGRESTYGATTLRQQTFQLLFSVFFFRRRKRYIAAYPLPEDKFSYSLTKASNKDMAANISGTL